MKKIAALLAITLTMAGHAFADAGVPKQFHGNWEETNSNQCKASEPFSVNQAGYGGTQSDCIFKNAGKSTSSDFVGTFSCDSGIVTARLSMAGSKMLLEETKKGSSKAMKRTFTKCS